MKYKYFSIEKGVNLEDIKTQYKQNAKKLHPDMHSSDQAEEYEKKFKDMKSEYEDIINKIRENVKSQNSNLSADEEANIDKFFDVILNKTSIPTEFHALGKVVGKELIKIFFNKINK